jgi:hypothetical protein
MPLTDIDSAKDIQQTYLPLMVAVFTFSDASILRLASRPLNTTEGGFTYGGNSYYGRIEDTDIGAVQGFFEGGIDIVPTVRLTVADADKFVWTNYEVAKGFSGAQLDLTFIFWDANSSTFSSDNILKFRGICDPAQSDQERIYISASSKLNLQRRYLPPVPIQRRCPWIFPTTAGERTASADEDSIFYECGYNPAGGSGTGSFTSCTYTKEQCIERGLWTLGRFGGIQWDPPSGSRSRDYVSGKWLDIENTPNQAKYGQPVPMVYGQAWVDAVAVNILGDGNSTRGEAIVCLGKVSSIVRVVVNDVELPAATDVTGGTNYIVRDPLLRYNVINQGDRDGAFNQDALFDGNSDPYGSMAVIEWVVPRRVAEASSAPRIRVLVKGPQIRVYTAVGVYSRVYSENPVWVLMDLLIWSGLLYADLDVQSFIDAAAICDATISYTDQFGGSSTHARYRCSMVLSQRRSAADVVRAVRMGCGAILVPNQDGKLAIFIKGTMASQQPSGVSGSNNFSPITSKNLAGAPTDGYTAYDFNKLLRHGGKSSLKIISPPLANTVNRVNFPFINSERDFAADSLSLLDTAAITRAGQEVVAQIDVAGINTLDQGKRIASRHLAEALRGNPRADKGGTELYEFDYSFGIVRLRAGHIARLSDTHHGLTNVPIRILQIRPSIDFREARIIAARHNDDWYVDTFGQEGDPETSATERNRLDRPAYPWGPRGAQPETADPIFSETDWGFRVSEQHEELEDGGSITKLVVSGRQPVNQFSPLNAPLVGRQGTVGSGSLAGGGTVYYLAVCAIDADGLLTAPSTVCEVVITAGGSSHAAVVPVIDWPATATGYALFAGQTPALMTWQKEAAGTPATVTLTDFLERDYGIPDQEFHRLRVKVKRIAHSGVWGQPIDVVAAGTLTITDAAWTVNEWAGYDGSVLGIWPGDELRILNFAVASNTADTLTVTPDPEALGVKLQDALVMRSKPTVGSDGGGHYIEDAKWQNTLENDGNGLAVDEEIGRLVRIIAGQGRGQVRRVASNTATRIYIEGEWDQVPNSGSRYIVEEPNWVTEQTTPGLANDVAAAVIDIPVEVTNYAQKTLLVKAYTVDGGNNESIDSLTPEREIYVYGRDYLGGQTWEATFGIEVGSDITPETDVSNHYDIRSVGVPFECVANQKDWPEAVDTILDVQQRSGAGAWASIFPPGNANKIMIPNGQTTEIRFTGFADGVSFADTDDQLRLDVLQGTASGVQVKVLWRLSPDPEGTLSGASLIGGEGGEGSGLLAVVL